MNAQSHWHDLLKFESCARYDVRFWALLVFGAGIFAATMMLEPSKNCDSNGNCAPILVIIACGLSGLATVIAIAHLWVNSSRGCCIDAKSGDLMWWQGRTRNRNENAGRINPNDIGRIFIDRQRESSDEIHLFDTAGNRQPYFDINVLPWRFEAWIGHLTVQFPHIIVEEKS